MAPRKKSYLNKTKPIYGEQNILTGEVYGPTPQPDVLPHAVLSPDERAQQDRALNRPTRLAAIALTYAKDAHAAGATSFAEELDLVKQMPGQQGMSFGTEQAESETVVSEVSETFGSEPIESETVVAEGHTIALATHMAPRPWDAYPIGTIDRYTKGRGGPNV